MKISLAVLIICVCSNGICAGPHGTDPGGFSGGGDAARSAQLANEETYNAVFNERQAAIAAEQQETRQIYSSDAWRNIDGQTNFAGGKGWFEIQGIRQSKMDNETLFLGAFGPILTIHVNNQQTYDSHNQPIIIPYYNGPDGMDRKFIVKNLPDEALEIDVQTNIAIQQKMAIFIGYQTNNSGNIPIFDYGTPCAKVWSSAELAAIKAKQDAPKNAALVYNEKLAASGDAYGLLRMAERYRDGDGVPKNADQARAYFLKSKLAGSPSAELELEQFDKINAASGQ